LFQEKWSLFKVSCVCLPLEKLIRWKHFLVKTKFDLVFRKIFSFYFGRKILFQKLWKNKKNILLFIDYIKFSPPSFNCYIYFLIIIFLFFSSISSLRIWFNLIFISIWSLFFLFLFLFLFSYPFFNWSFLCIRFDPHFFYCYLFNLKWFMKLDFFFNFIIF
jgi:hypothetical protein